MIAVRHLPPIDYSMLPEHMRGGARLYIENGVPPGSFMMAVLKNDLTGAFGRADQTNLQYMREWCDWLYNQCPSVAWRTDENINAWIKQGGLNGKEE